MRLRAYRRQLRIMHELAHLLVAGHGPEFHALMDSVMPDWKQRRAKLRG